MTTKLSRRELYELVWTKPRTELSKEMGVSDVWIGKQCRALNVPAPPPGYWANLAAQGRRKAKYIKPPLSYTLVEHVLEVHEDLFAPYRSFAKDDFDTPVPEVPKFSQTVAEVVAARMQLASSTPRARASGARGNHPIVQKLLAEDERLASLKSKWDMPKYRSPMGLRAIEALNQMLWRWVDLGFRPSSGGIRHISMCVACEGYSRSFELRVVEPDTRPLHFDAERLTSRLELWFDRDDRHRHRDRKQSPALTFTAINRKLLDTIVEITLVHWAESFRDWMAWQQQWLARDRADALKKVEEAKERDRQQLAAERHALLLTRARLLHGALKGIDRADQLRSLVSALEGAIAARGSQPSEFTKWKAWILREADSLDPRTRSADELRDWLAEFRLDER